MSNFRRYTEDFSGLFIYKGGPAWDFILLDTDRGVRIGHFTHQSDAEQVWAKYVNSGRPRDKTESYTDLDVFTLDRNITLKY